MVRIAHDWDWRMMKLKTHQSEAHLSTINPRLNAVLWLLCRTPHLEVVQLRGHSETWWNMTQVALV